MHREVCKARAKGLFSRFINMGLSPLLFFKQAPNYQGGRWSTISKGSWNSRGNFHNQRLYCHQKKTLAEVQMRTTSLVREAAPHENIQMHALLPLPHWLMEMLTAKASTLQPCFHFVPRPAQAAALEGSNKPSTRAATSFLKHN